MDVSLLVDGVATQPVKTVNGAYTIPLTADLTEGPHTVVAESAGLSSSALKLTVDTLAPILILDSHPSTPSAAATPGFAFTSEVGATFACQLLPTISTFAPCSSGQPLAAQPDGSYTFTVRASDLAGNVSAPVSFTWQIDTTAPTVTLQSPRPSENTTKTTPTFTFTSDDPGATFECQLLPTISTFAPCLSGQMFPAQVDGDHRLTVRAVDLAGNVSAPASFSFRIDTAAPRVSTHTPVAGVRQAGNLTASFTENVSGLSARTYILRQASTRATVAAAVSYNTTTHVATLKPTAVLAPGTRYTVTLSSLIKDTAGNPLAPTTWSFVTGPRPTVIRKSPAANAVRVALSANVTATFSESVSGLSPTTFTLRSSTGRAVSAAVSYNPEPTPPR